MAMPWPEVVVDEDMVVVVECVDERVRPDLRGVVKKRPVGEEELFYTRFPKCPHNGTPTNPGRQSVECVLSKNPKREGPATSLGGSFLQPDWRLPDPRFSGIPCSPDAACFRLQNIFILSFNAFVELFKAAAR